MASEQIKLDMPLVDYDKTASNVMVFLTNENYYPRLRRICNQANPEHLQSPRSNGMPGSAGYGNTKEQRMLKYLYAKTIVDGVQQTYDKGSNLLKIVLDTVLGQHSASSAKEKLYVENTRYYELRKKALNEFADILEVQNINCPDLHIYIVKKDG